ncbi:MAG: hypothetical protein WA821_01535 [Anaerolineales bacterium]
MSKTCPTPTPPALRNNRRGATTLRRSTPLFNPSPDARLFEKTFRLACIPGGVRRCGGRREKTCPASIAWTPL